MKTKHSILYKVKFLFLCLIAMQSCSLSEDCIDSDYEQKNGSFTVSRWDSYIIEQARGQSSSEQKLNTSGSMIASMRVEQWGTTEQASRANITGDEYTWGSGACISLYMTKSGESNTVAGLRDVPFDPNTYKTYTRYKPYKDTDDPIETDGVQTVTNTAFFFKEKTGIASDLVSQKLDFYGYYPRPYDKASNNLYYVKTSIINEDDAHNSQTTAEWNKLSYNFEDIQTDENLSYHDIMCSYPEKLDGNGIDYRYGNIDKGPDDNVQLFFKHMFCLLNIEIDKGMVYDNDGQKKCEVSGISISGSTISTRGILDVKSCTTSIIPVEGAEIKRLFTNTTIKDASLKTTMIVQPIPDADAGMSEEDKQKRFILTCTIDGIPFTCSMPDIKLEAGKKYSIKLKLAPNGGFVFRVWSGATVEVDGTKCSAGEYYFPKIQSDHIAVSSDSQTEIVKIMRNGEYIDNKSGTYEIQSGENDKVYYDIVASPSDWYAQSADMHIHYDAIWNSKYGSYTDTSDESWRKCNIWSDLSGNGNDGTLKMFDNTATSGWYDNGLWFDGVDDIVTYSGTINPQKYTVELYIKLDTKNQKSWARITAEGNQYPCYYVSGDMLQLYAHGHQGGLHKMTDEEKENLRNGAQLDFVFDAEIKCVTTYINGVQVEKTSLAEIDAVSIPIASLGNRIQDNTRALRATYYSFILYDKALTSDEISQNYKVNKNRYGETKQ